MAASAGAKKTVTTEKTVLRSRTRPMSAPTMTMPMSTTARNAFVITSISRRSTRSTYTPASADSSTEGTRKVRNRALTAELRLLAERTTTVRA
jgi:hypothetical protein